MNNTRVFPRFFSPVLQTFMFYSWCEEEATTLFTSLESSHPIRALHLDTIDSFVHFLIVSSSSSHASWFTNYQVIDKIISCLGIMTLFTLNKCMLLKMAFPLFFPVFLYKIRGTLLIFQIRKEICNMFVIFRGSLGLGHEILSSSVREILKNDVLSKSMANMFPVSVSMCWIVAAVWLAFGSSPLLSFSAVWKLTEPETFAMCRAFVCSTQSLEELCSFECTSDIPNLKDKCPHKNIKVTLPTPLSQTAWGPWNIQLYFSLLAIIYFLA